MEMLCFLSIRKKPTIESSWSIFFWLVLLFWVERGWLLMASTPLTWHQIDSQAVKKIEVLVTQTVLPKTLEGGYFLSCSCSSSDIHECLSACLLAIPTAMSGFGTRRPWCLVYLLPWHRERLIWPHRSSDENLQGLPVSCRTKSKPNNVTKFCLPFMTSTLFVWPSLALILL